MSNAVTPFTVPRNFTLSVTPVSGNDDSFIWQEGNGLDMEGYTDITRDGVGANWINYGSGSSAGVQTWANVGGDYYNDTTLDTGVNYTTSFDNGTEDLEVDISQMVEEFLNPTMTAASLEVTIGSTLLDGSTVELTSTDGTTVKYKAQAGSGQAVSGSSGGLPITLFGYGSSIANSLTNLSASIDNATYGHDGKIDVAIDGGKLTLTQVTAGRGGNTTSTFQGWADVTVGGLSAVPTSFTGGQGLDNYGLGVHLTASQEVYVAAADASANVPANTAGARRSYYTKKFFARSSEFFFKRPVLEARWEDTKKDDRGNFFYSSSLSTAKENLHTLYLYNYHRGILRNIPDLTNNIIYVGFFSGSADNSAPAGSEILLVRDNAHVNDASKVYATGGLSSQTGIYTCSVALTAAASPLTTVFDVWKSAYNGTQYWTGSFSPVKLDLSTENPSTEFVTNVTNLKPLYNRSETARFRVFTRQKDWNPTIYTKAVATTTPFIVESGSYSVARVIDGVEAVPYGTGSDLHTMMSFDVSGSYFDLDMSILEPGYAYRVKFAYYNGSVGDWQEQPQEFKFRVED
tara:strand:- start:1374 stop:3092 length:1719 start_codon:yes stop_codon:yes gene_type:complete